MRPVVAQYRELVAKRIAAKASLADLNRKVIDQQQLVDDLARVEQFFNVLADERRQFLEDRVQSLVDQGLKRVFGLEYDFKVRSELSGKQVKTRFFVVNEGLELNLLDSVGGGIADVVSFLLRIVLLILKRPPQRKILILDEPFKWVSAGHMASLAELITELSETLKLQIIFVTHRPELVEAATTVVRVSKNDGISQAEVEVLG
jgi:DNA repair exonuclease SbcCD ATPase subunit